MKAFRLDYGGAKALSSGQVGTSRKIILPHDVALLCRRADFSLEVET
jgi:hypothetical protein